jgi:hypothetical protein
MIPPRPAQGVREGDRVKIAIAMPHALFNKIAERARRDGVSFNRTAVDILELGIFDYEESERHDPSVAGS